MFAPGAVTLPAKLPLMLPETDRLPAMSTPPEVTVITLDVPLALNRILPVKLVTAGVNTALLVTRLPPVTLPVASTVAANTPALAVTLAPLMFPVALRVVANTPPVPKLPTLALPPTLSVPAVARLPPVIVAAALIVP